MFVLVLGSFLVRVISRISVLIFQERIDITRDEATVGNFSSWWVSTAWPTGRYLTELCQYMVVHGLLYGYEMPSKADTSGQPKAIGLVPLVAAAGWFSGMCLSCRGPFVMSHAMPSSLKLLPTGI